MPKVIDVDQRRSELARAAGRLIARRGIGAATMREVAAEAGLTTGALTHYFSDKRELMLHTFRESLGGRKQVRAERAERDPRAALLQSLEGALPLDDDRRRHWMVSIAFCAEAAGDPDLMAVQQLEYREYKAHLTSLVKSAGLAKGAAAGTLAERLVACADGIAVQALFDHDGWPAERQLTRLHELIDPLLAHPRPAAAKN